MIVTLAIRTYENWIGQFVKSISKSVLHLVYILNKS